MGKLHIPLLLPITKHVISNNFLKKKKYELVLIIKGRGMSVSLINELKTVSPKVIGYNFDSFSYNSAPLKWYKYTNKYFTFDYRDAEKYTLPIVELFSSVSDKINRKQKEYELSAILRNHSERLNYTNSVLNIINPKKFFIYIYEKNIFTFLINFINSPILYLKYMKHIKFKPLSYEDYIDVLNKSTFTIDFAHPKQSGITIRCFEALSTQTKIITNNLFVKKNKHFNNQNTIIYSSKNNKKNLKTQYTSMFNNKIKKYKRTIYDFIKDLVE
jgi:hypothetical protein